MFEKFGEFDSAEEMNKKAEELKKAGDTEKIYDLARENGIDKEDAEDFISGFQEKFVSPLMAAAGKIKVESNNLEIAGVLEDWSNVVLRLCAENVQIARKARKKSRSLAGCMAELITFSFENKIEVSDEIVKITKIEHNGKKEPLRGPLYMGVPNNAEVKRIAEKYYKEG